MSRTMPFEIYFEIFRYLRRNDLKQCLYVCQHWNNPAKTCLYQIIQVTTQASLDAFLRTLVSVPSLRHLVKQLVIRIRTPTPLGLEEDNSMDCIGGVMCVNQLNDVFQLCPKATDVLFSFCQFENRENEPINIKLNRGVKKLSVNLCSLTKAALNYICQQFPCVRQLEVVIDKHDPLDGRNLETKMFQQLASYAHTMDHVILKIGEIPNRMELLQALQRFQWQGYTDIQIDGFMFEHDSSKNKYSVLDSRCDVDGFQFTHENIAYLNQLDEFDFDISQYDSQSRIPDVHYQILSHCKRLKKLSIDFSSLEYFEIPGLPVTSLSLGPYGANPGLLNQFSYMLPCLEELEIIHFFHDGQYEEASGDFSMEVLLPVTSLAKLKIEMIDCVDFSVFCLQLSQSGIESTYQLCGTTFYEAEINICEEHKPSDKAANLKLTCKAIQQLEIICHPERYPPVRTHFTYSFDRSEYTET